MTAFGMTFPLDMSTLVSAPRYSTDIFAGRNGQEVRNALWQDPLYAYDASFAVKTYDDIETLVSFFHAVKGREQSFLLKDWTDFKVSDWTEFAETVDGVETNFQLIKIYANAVAGDYTRTITKPKQIEGTGGVTVRDNGTPIDPADYSFSSSTGIVNIPVPPISGHTLDFTIDEFYIPVRFDIDQLPFDLQVYRNSNDTGLVNIPSIPMVEVRGE